MTKEIDNLALWNRVEETDPAYTKQFTRGGGFKGTATNVTYLVKKATREFGPIGIGWGFRVDSEEMLKGVDGTLIHKLKLVFWYELNGRRGEIEQFGQTEFSGTRGSGKTFTDEEAPKKSLTDALSKCLSYLGFAADVHLGLYDDNKYVNDLKRVFRDEDEFAPPPPPRDPANSNSRDKGETPAAPAEAPSEPKPDANPGVRDEAEMTDTELVELMKAEIDRKETINAVTDYMLDPETVTDLKSLPSELSESVRDHAKKRLKALGFPAGKNKKLG